MSGPVLHFCQVPSKYSKGYSCYRVDTKSFSNKTKGYNSKSKNARVANLVCDMSSHPDLHFYQVQRVITPKVRKPELSILYVTLHPDLHFYQVSSKYSKWYSSYRGDKKFYAHADDNANGIHPKNNVPHPPPPFGSGGHNNLGRGPLGEAMY